MPEELYVTMSWWAEWAHNRADDYIIRINIAHTADKLIIFTLYEQLPRERQLDVAVLSEWGHENQLHHAIMWNMNSAQMASSVATWKPWTYHTTNTAWQLHSSMLLPEMDVLVDWRWIYSTITAQSVALWLPWSKIGTTSYPAICIMGVFVPIQSKQLIWAVAMDFNTIDVKYYGSLLAPLCHGCHVLHRIYSGWERCLGR